jgi:cytochrome oxidase Cu insertion factor (SCO1/SenC/PrrC family)
MAFVVPAGASAPAQPPQSVGVATKQPLPSAVARATFVNQAGQTTSLGALRGRTVFLVPLLTLCGDTCPFTAGNLIQLRDRLDQANATGVDVIAVDVDPYRDTVARLKAYEAILGTTIPIWTSTGATTPTLTKKELASKNPVGTGDQTKSLTTLEKFLGWSVQVVPQGNPPATDWMAPHEKLTYDISHSDGFWIVDPSQQVRFISGTQPAFTGKLAKTLATFMGYKSNIYKSPVYKSGWTPAQALAAIEWVDGRTYP